MKISTELFAKITPSDPITKNFIKLYPHFLGNIDDLIFLDKIGCLDKLWLFLKLMNKNQLVKFSRNRVESVYHIFEKNRPEDKRIINLLNFIDTINDFENLSSEETKNIKYLLDISCTVFVHDKIVMSVVDSSYRLGRCVLSEDILVAMGNSISSEAHAFFAADNFSGGDFKKELTESALKIASEILKNGNVK